MTYARGRIFVSHIDNRFSRRALIALRSSTVAIGSVLLVTGGAAFAQEAPNPQSPNANPPAAATVQAPAPAADPTPNQAAAAAQTATNAAADDGDIVVTGIRASLANSAKIKRNSTLIVDSVSAEDIGKLPDVSIADSLARLPGVTAQRLEGRDQRLSIRGLGPDFSTTLLNGREQVTVGDNRGVEFDQYPSEFFRNVNVYKSADASLIAAGIAGTVDMRMLRPLDQAGRVIAVNARGQMNGIDNLNPDSSRYGYRVSGTYVDKFANDTLGIAIGVASTLAPTQNERYNAWGYNGAGTAANPYVLSGAKPYVQSNELKRYGGVATIEWQPSDSFHSTFDALYTNFTETQRLRGIEFPLAGNVPAANQTINTVNNGFATSETFAGVHGIQRNDYNQRKADNYSFGWNNDLKLTDHIHLNVDASWSHMKRTDFLLETYTGTGYQASGPGDTVTVTQNSNGTYKIVPTLDYTNTNIFKLTDPQGWGYNGTQSVVQAGFLNQPSFKDDLKSLRASLNGEFDNSLVKSWEVGGNYSRRQKTSAYKSFFLCPKAPGTDCTVSSNTPTSAPIPQQAILGENIPLDYLGVPAVLALDPIYLYNNAYSSYYDNRPSSLVRDNVVIENVWTGYAKINLDGYLGDKAVKGSLGAQVVHSEQRGTGQIASVNNGIVTIAPADQRVNYTNFLPSATFSVELIHGGYVKMGASQTMVRPRLDQERVTQDVSVNTANIVINNPNIALNPVFSSSGGNVALRPYQSTNIDLSFEKYFDGGGYVAVSGYFKHLTDFVDPNNSYAFNFSSLLPGLTPAQQAIVTQIGGTIGPVSAPANTGRGEILGVEGTISLPFKMVTTALDGFGIFVSGNYTDSTVKYANNQAVTLPGLSDWTASGTIYFEKWGFQARANYRYRSSFLAEVAGLSASPTYRTAQNEAILDAQIGYEFQGGFLKGLSIMAQAKNLTDRPFVTYQNGDPRQVIDYQRYGRDYYLSVGYKF